MTNHLIQLASLGFLPDMAIKGFVVLVAMIAVVGCLHRSSAACRHWIWFLGLLSLLAIPFLSMFLPNLPLHLPVGDSQYGPLDPAVKWISAASSDPRTVNRDDFQSSGAQGASPMNSSEEPYGGNESSGFSLGAARPLGIERTSLLSPVGRWRHVALGIWILGAGAALLPWFVGMIRVTYLCRESRPVDDPHSHHALGEVSRELGLRRRVQLLKGPGSLVPMTLGWLRPKILLPLNWTTWPVERRRAVMIHELAHIQRWDVVSQGVAYLGFAIHWFNPLAWLALSRLRAEREMACDDQVLRCGTNASEYASHLLEVVKAFAEVRSVSVAALGIAGAVGIEQRFRALLDSRRSREPLHTRSIATSSLVAACVFILLAALQPIATPARGSAGNSASLVQRSDNAGTASVGIETQARTEATGNAVTMSDLLGRVRDMSGRPIPHTSILAKRGGGSPSHEIIETDAEGQFRIRFENVTDQGVTLVAYRAGLAPALTSLRPPFPDSIELVLSPAEPFVGIVNDSEGKAIQGASVHLQGIKGFDDDPTGTRRSGSAHGSMQIVRYGIHPLESATADTPLKDLFVARSDEHGVFRFEAMPAASELMLKLTAPGMGSLQLPRIGLNDMTKYLRGTAAEPARITMYPEAIVMGRVVTKLPDVNVANLKVILQGSGAPENRMMFGEATTDEKGQFAMGGFAEGTCNIMLRNNAADAPWTYRAIQDAKLQPGRASMVTIELIEGVLVSGSVVNQWAHPIKGVSVGMYGPMRPRSGAAIAHDVTDEFGKYSMRLPPGETYFYVSGCPEGFTILREAQGAETGHLVVIPDSEKSSKIPAILIKLTATVPLQGSIVDVGGRPIAGARILQVCDQVRCTPSGQPCAVADAQGHFSVPKQDGQYAVGQRIKVRVGIPSGKEFDVEAVPMKDGETLITVPVSTEPEQGNQSRRSADEVWTE
jgi:beta-lactamase regulating signal transducer with metallopeptidase domain